MGKFSKAILWTIGILVGLGILLRVTILKAWKLPDDPVLSASVAPSLAGGDLVLMMYRGLPSFGDLVRCSDPENPERYTVGRIVGVAGDVVDLESFRLMVNNKHYDNHSACPKPKFKVEHPTSGAEVELNCDVVEMGGGWHYRGYSPKSFNPQAKTHMEVGEGMVFLLSDDREFHDDSRDYGLLPIDSCKDRIVFRLWGKEAWGDTSRRMMFIH